MITLWRNKAFIAAFVIMPVGLMLAFSGIQGLIDKGTKEGPLIYENFFLCIIFLALIFRNLSFPGTGVMLVFSVLFLVPYFITTTIKFFKVNYKFGKPLVVILTFGSFATVFLGITYMMKTMHCKASVDHFVASVHSDQNMCMQWKHNSLGSACENGHEECAELLIEPSKAAGCLDTKHWVSV